MRFFSLKNTPIYAESWNVAFRKKGCGKILKDNDTPFTIIKNNFRYWAADPFVIEYGGNTYIFAELYDYVLRRGVLGYCSIFDGKVSKWKPIIKEPYHLSYPCLIESEGKLYLMPESSEAQVLTVYEAVDFPNKWEKRKILRDGIKFADTTPFPYKEKNIALTHNIDDPEHPRLMLIDLDNQHADTIVSNEPVLRTRPAGHVFLCDENIIRPAQVSLDTGDGYGKGLVFYKCHLDENLQYFETVVYEVHPEELDYDTNIFLDGIHTYNFCEHYEVIDLKTRRFNILNFFMRIVGKFLQ